MRFDPDTVKKAVLWWDEDDASLYAIALYDKNNKHILRIGKMDNFNFAQHTVILNEGERIVGVKSYHDGNAEHCDF